MDKLYIGLVVVTLIYFTIAYIGGYNSLLELIGN